MGVDTGQATGVVAIRTVRSNRRKRRADCLRIPAKRISYISELRKAWCPGVISRSLVCCCRGKSSVEPLSSSRTQVGRWVRSCIKESAVLAFFRQERLWKFGAYVPSYRRPRAHYLANGGVRKCRSTHKHHLPFVSCGPPVLRCSLWKEVTQGCDNGDRDVIW